MVGTSTPTSSETPVTPNISGTSVFIEEVPQFQEDIRIDPSVMVNNSILETTLARADPETEVHLPEHPEVEFQNSKGVTPPVSVTTKSIPSSAPEIFYGHDGLPLHPGLIAIEGIVEDLPSSTPLHFGTGIHLYPSILEVSSFNHPSSQVLVESLGNLLDILNMSEQPSTSRTVSSDTTMTDLLVSIPTMFADIPSVLASYYQLAGVHSGTVSTTWYVPISSSRISSGISYVETQKVDPICLQRPIYPLSTGLPPYGG